MPDPIQSTPPDPRDQFIEYHQRDDGIQVFNFLGNRPEGVTEWARHMDVIVDATPDGGTIRQLMDVQHGVAPMSSMLSEIRALAERHANRPPNRVAIIHTSSMSAALLSALIPLLPVHNLVVRYFKATEQDEAIGWLLADK